MRYEYILIIPFILLLMIVPAYGYVKMVDIPKTIQVGSQFIIHGTSAPSNATRVNCTVAVNINGAGYQAANMSSTGTTWTLSNDGHAIKVGDNRVTARMECFQPDGNSTIPNFIRHHSDNITGFTNGSSSGANTTNNTGVPITDPLIN